MIDYFCLGSREVEAAIQRAEGRPAAKEAGHDRIHGSHRQVSEDAQKISDVLIVVGPLRR